MLQTGVAITIASIQRCLLNGIAIHLVARNTYCTNSRMVYVLKCKKKTCTGSAMYLIGGKYITEDELINGYVLMDGSDITRGE